MPHTNDPVKFLKFNIFNDARHIVKQSIFQGLFLGKIAQPERVGCEPHAILAGAFQ